MSTQTTTLQTTNVSVVTKSKADQRAKDAGFSSIQDVIRIFLKDVADGKFSLEMNWENTSSSELQRSINEYKSGNYIEIKPEESVSAKIKNAKN